MGLVRLSYIRHSDHTAVSPSYTEVTTPQLRMFGVSLQ